MSNGGLFVKYWKLINEHKNLQDLCASAYQLAGLTGAPQRFLDQLNDGVNGDRYLRNDETLLPLDPSEFDVEAIRNIANALGYELTPKK